MDVSAVAALKSKASDLWAAGHRPRAVEYEKRALVAAQSLGAEDCLVVASLQLSLANLMYNVAHQDIITMAPGSAQEVAAITELFFAAAATVQRRRAAGTLLPGCCRAAEEAWSTLLVQRKCERGDGMEPGVGVATAPLVGYRGFLDVAKFCVTVIGFHYTGTATVPEEQLRLCVALMTDAAELMMQPRLCEHLGMSAEGGFAYSCSRAPAAPCSKKNPGRFPTVRMQ
jgi:hypothetical protein